MDALSAVITYKPGVPVPSTEMPQEKKITLYALAALEMLTIALFLYYKPLIGLVLLAAATYLDQTIAKCARNILDPPPALTAADKDATFQSIWDQTSAYVKPLDKTIADCTAMQTFMISERSPPERPTPVGCYGKDKAGHAFFLIKIYYMSTTSNMTEDLRRSSSNLGSDFVLFYKQGASWYRKNPFHAQRSTPIEQINVEQLEKLKDGSVETIESGDGQTRIVSSFCLLPINPPGQ